MQFGHGTQDDPTSSASHDGRSMVVDAKHEYEIVHHEGVVKVRCLDPKRCKEKGAMCKNTKLRRYPCRQVSKSILRRCYHTMTRLHQMLQSVVSILEGTNQSLPNCRIPLTLGDPNGVANDIACVAKLHNEDPCFLVPNPSFGNLRRWDGREAYVTEKNLPWMDKRDAAFYRGSCREDYDMYRLQPRLDLMSIDDDRLDVSWMRTSGVYKCLQLVTRTPLQLQHHVGIVRAKAREEEFTQYKVLLNLPGSRGGIYSRHLAKLWNKGSIVVMWENTAKEWYFDQLVEGKNVIVVNKTTVLSKVNRLLELSVDEQKNLAMGAQDVFGSSLTGRKMAERWQEAFHSLCLQDVEINVQGGRCAT